MGTNNFGTECLSIGGVTDGAMQAAIVGDAINFTPIAVIGTPTITLTRKPAGSAAAVSSGSITFDLPGYYTVTVANAGFTRTITIVVFPASTLTLPLGRANASGTTVSRQALQLVIQQGATLATIAAALEIATPNPNAILGAGTPVYWANYMPG